MDAQLKKGILEMCILQILSKEDTYGYPLMQTMQDYFPTMDESTIYTILRRINKEGYTETYYSDKSGGPTRKYYHLTIAGKDRLSQMNSEWETIISIVNNIKKGGELP